MNKELVGGATQVVCFKKGKSCGATSTLQEAAGYFNKSVTCRSCSSYGLCNKYRGQKRSGMGSKASSTQGGPRRQRHRIPAM